MRREITVMPDAKNHFLCENPLVEFASDRARVHPLYTYSF